MTSDFRSLRILLDMDGVLQPADFDKGLVEQTSGFISWPSEAEERRARYCTDYLKRRNAVLARQHIEETAFFRTLPVIEGAKEGVAELLSLGFDLWVCSKPLEANPWCASDKMAWIKQYFPELSGRVILAPRKCMIKGSILLDDAHKAEDFRLASWVPVWYPYKHNEAPDRYYWKWGDSPRKLEDYAYGWADYNPEAPPIWDRGV